MEEISGLCLNKFCVFKNFIMISYVLKCFYMKIKHDFDMLSFEDILMPQRCMLVDELGCMLLVMA